MEYLRLSFFRHLFLFLWPLIIFSIIFSFFVGNLAFYALPPALIICNILVSLTYHDRGNRLVFSHDAISRRGIEIKWEDLIISSSKGWLPIDGKYFEISSKKDANKKLHVTIGWATENSYKYLLDKYCPKGNPLWQVLEKN